MVPPGSGDPNFFALNANSSKVVKATDLKLGMRVPSDNPDMTPSDFLFKKGRD